MDARVREMVNEQIAHEFYAAYLYLAMSAHMDREGYEGFARWFRLQAKEEEAHALRLYDHLLTRGEPVELKPLDAPPAEFGAPVEAFQAALDHERKVTGLIDRLYEEAVAAKDHPAQVMLQWFIEEQVEEEDSAGTAVQRLEMAGDDTAAVMFLDREYGQRSSEDT